jgi:uncharacterized membrane protein
MLTSRRTMVSGHVERARRSGITAVLALLVLAAATRMVLLERHGLWTDELFSLAMATGHGLEHTAAEANAALGDFVERPEAVAPAVYASYLVHDPLPAGPGRVVRAVWRSDTNPPLYYLLLNGWTRVFGTSDVALRAFSVVASLACFPFLWRLGRAVAGRQGAIVTLLLFAVVPPSVYYSTEGRMYSLLWLFAVALMWQTWALWRAGARPRSVLVWILMGAAGLLTHYFFVFVWLAAILWLLLHPGRATRRSLWLGVALTAIVVLPWYVRAPASLEVWRVTGGWLQIRPAHYSALQAALLQPWRFLTLRVGAVEETRWNYVNLAVYAALGATFLTTGGLRALFSPTRRLLVLWLLAACAGPAACDLLRGTHTLAVPRYALAGMPAAFLLVGFALARIRPWARALLTGAIVALCVVGLYLLHHVPSRQKEPFREVGSLLAREAKADDLVLAHSIPSGVAGIARALESARGEAPAPGFAAWVDQLGQRRVPEDLLALASGRHRVILVDLKAVTTRAPEREWLKAHASLVSERHMETASILVFAPSTGSAVIAPCQSPAAGSFKPLLRAPGDRGVRIPRRPGSPGPRGRPRRPGRAPVGARGGRTCAPGPCRARRAGASFPADGNPRCARCTWPGSGGPRPRGPRPR